ncbi:hypothetical protein G7Z17_g6942 [Cylindrodendrum hubeiense]|uniref:Uncharacterized protein n=1 Tax=Cylindrodendrum hubeiense TaxID=595255 RepID=A0A9P5HE63_9HYPO|nr:hypothetical protein G7Z17_g6942 [Cylindrodendrum hubeiense]
MMVKNSRRNPFAQEESPVAIPHSPALADPGSPAPPGPGCAKYSVPASVLILAFAVLAGWQHVASCSQRARSSGAAGAYPHAATV